MKSPAFVSFFVFGLWLACRAETPPAAAAPGAPPPETPPSDRAPRRRTISPDLAAKLREALPKYSPRQSSSSALPATGGDGPQNDILRLPHYEVREQKVPEFREREMLTPTGRIDVALKRHPGLNFGPLKSWNLRRGLEMLEEEHVLEIRRELGELNGFVRDTERLKKREAKPVSDKK